MIETTNVGLVDDHAWFRQTLADLIANHIPNFVVTLEASNGSEFIAKIKSLDEKDLPNIVIMDINMPVMDGFETAKWIRETHPDIKILTLSLNQTEEPIIRMLTLGVAGY